MIRYQYAMLLLLLPLMATAQKTIQVPLAGTAVLRDVPDKWGAQVYSLEAPEPDGEHGQAELRMLKAETERMFPHRRAAPEKAGAKSTAALPPVIVKSFMPDSGAAIPPDNYVAVSNDTTGVAVMNVSISTVNPATGEILTKKTLGSFTRPAGIGTALTQDKYGRYDPKIIYDAEADRYIFVSLAGINEYNWIIVAFSQTSDPSGGWNFYKFYGDYANDTTWFDYPTIAITHSDFFLTGNKVVYNGTFQAGFRKSVIYQIQKRDGYAGAATLTTRQWDTVKFGGAPIRNIFPVKGGSSIKGPDQYFLSVRNMALQNDSVFLIRISDSTGSPGAALSVTAMKSNLAYGFPPNGRQPGRNSSKLQTNDGRVLGAFAEGTEIQFVSTSVQPSTGADAIYHGRMANYATAPSVQAAFITVDTLDFAYPNISFAGLRGGLNTSIISFDLSGPNTYPGMGAVMWDGSAHSPLLLVKAGSDTIHINIPGGDTLQRWGDYTGSQPQWNRPGFIWTVGLYGQRPSTYGPWMAQLASPYARGLTVPAPPASRTTAQLYPNPALRYIKLRFTVAEEGTLHFAIYSMSGQLVDAVTEAHCERGTNEILFNTASLSPGQYLLKAFDAKGTATVSKMFVRE